ncbi:hypothetical protein B0H14DRAFT_3512397 [Mycena olivaceomarginata]|nr:hypothetical protein B0H14DRAFT_3512397 [Mycena olivaceomarginata]
MSHKYEADALRKRALIHLSHAYPTTLDEWDDLPDELPWDGEAVEITAIARQLGADWILPTSFYRICQRSFDRAIITGDELSDADKVNCIRGLRYLETTGAVNQGGPESAPPVDLAAPDSMSVCAYLQTGKAQKTRITMEPTARASPWLEKGRRAEALSSVESELLAGPP